MVGLTFVYAGILLYFGNPEIGLLASGFLGLYLVADRLRRGRQLHVGSHLEPDHRGGELARDSPACSS